MKKKVLINISILITLNMALVAQNWQFFNKNNKYNYLNLNDSSISTIWVDSTSTDGSDSLFLFNKVLHYNTIWSEEYNDSIFEALLTYNKLFNQLCTTNGDSLFYLGMNKEWLIKPKKGLNVSWEFSDGIIATISECKEDTIFNLPDSSKTIALSNGWSIKLSKTFGIIRWFRNNNEEYKLIGIDCKYGISIPSFLNYFEFHVGDIFEYHHSGYIETDDAEFYDIYKYSISSKEVNGDTISYHYEGRMKSGVSGIGWNESGPYPYTYEDYYQYSETRSIVNSSEYYFNIFKGELIDNEKNTVLFYPVDLFLPYGNGEPLFFSQEVILSENDEVIRQFGPEDFYMSDFDFLTAIDTNSEMILFQSINSREAVKYMIKPGIGITSFKYTDHMSPWQLEFSGAIIDGDTIGTIHDDSYFVASTQEYPELYFSAFPNPFTDVITINLEEKATVKIYDLTGNLCYSSLLRPGQNIFEPSSLQPGIYVMQLVNEKGSGQKKIIKK